jgi:hypothetical protein
MKNIALNERRSPTVATVDLKTPSICSPEKQPEPEKRSILSSNKKIGSQSNRLVSLMQGERQKQRKVTPILKRTAARTTNTNRLKKDSVEDDPLFK